MNNPAKMPFKVMLFAHRKPGTTPIHFRDHLEGPHMALLKRLMGDFFPLSHVRRYVQRDEAGVGAFPAAVLVGEQDDFDYDVVSELTFADEDAFKAYFERYQSKDIARALADDEMLFMDSIKMRAVVIGEVMETTPDSVV